MKKQLIKGLASLLLGYCVVLIVIIGGATLLWNWIIPSLGGPYITIWQTVLLYALFNLYRFNWLETFNKYVKSQLPKGNNT